MALSADNLIDRIRLKSEVIKWRSLAIVIAVLFAVSLAAAPFAGMTGDSIARISVDGIILENRDRDLKLTDIKNDKHVKAVNVYVNSPGGTMVGGENLYHSLREIAAEKPVVAVMGSVAASGGYMTAIAADRIFAHAGTITGSIGVIMQSAEFTELAKKMGVNFLTFKSGELKASPSPFEQLTPKTAQVINTSIADSFNTFVQMVKDRRPVSEADIRTFSDGRIFTGSQAVENHLVDELGGEDAAVKWLRSERNISAKISVKDIDLDAEKPWMEKISSRIMGGDSAILTKLNGMTTLWSPNVL